MKDVLIGFLSKTLNMDADSVAEKLYKKSDDGKITEEANPDALKELLALDAERVKGLKGDTDTKTAFDNGYKKAQKEVAERWEKDVKDTLGLKDSDKVGLDLLKEGISKITKAPLEDDKVKVHPLFLQLEKRLSDEKKAVEMEWKAKLEEVEKGMQRKEVFSKVKGKGAEYFDGLKPVLPADMSKAAVLRQEFIDKVESYDWEVSGDDFIQMKDGKRVEDPHGNPITLKTFVSTEAAKRFDFQKQDPAGNGGNKNNPGDGGTKLEKIPKTQAERDAMIFNASSREERIAIQAAFEKASAGAS